jgi:hypothetical protein
MSMENDRPASPPSREGDGPVTSGGLAAGASVEAIVRRVTELVIRELREGMQISLPGDTSNPRNRTCGGDSGPPADRTERVDMSGYKTPVLTERHVRGLRPLTVAVSVPAGTVVSPKARELLRDRNIQLCNE